MPWMFSVLKDFDGNLFELVRESEEEIKEVRKKYMDEGAITSLPIEVPEGYVPFEGSVGQRDEEEESVLL